MSENIGERIKELRIEKKLTLTELGEKVNLSAGHLSQIERNKTTPSLTTLMDIAKAIKVDLRYFFETETELVYIKRAPRGNDKTPLTASIVKEPLTPGAGSRMLGAFQVTIQPKTAPEQLDLFLGEEICFVLSGSLTIYAGEEWIELATGDSIHIDACQTRSWSNTGDEPCVFIWGRAASLEDR